MSVGGRPTLDALQLWILTTVVEHPWYFPVLTSAEHYRRQSNYRIPDVTPDGLLQAVEHLFKSDYLSAERGRDLVKWNNVDQLKEWIHGPEPVACFGLTAAGGARWEQECKADWSLFLNGLGPCTTTDVAGEEFTSWMHYEGATWSRVTEYARRYEIWEWHTRLRARTRELRPWKATYWKSLPSGFRISTKYRRGTEESKALWLAKKGELKMADFTNWYQDPH